MYSHFSYFITRQNYFYSLGPNLRLELNIPLLIKYVLDQVIQQKVKIYAMFNKRFIPIFKKITYKLCNLLFS